MDKEVLCEYLKDLGWVKPETTPADDLDNAVRAYQAFHGLDVTGEVDSTTERHIVQPRICGLPDIMEVRGPGGICMWGHKNVKCKIAGQLSRLSKEAFKQAFQEAISYWNAVCGINLTMTDGNDGNIVVGTGNIDGQNGTLAWSELPCGNQNQLNQKYDDSESWIISATPRNGLDIVRVIAHEVGHALGLPHLASGNLMQPTYDPNIRKPQAGDIQEVKRRYGNPTAPVPPPVPDPGTPSSPVDPTKPCAQILSDLASTPEGKQLLTNVVKALFDALRGR